MAQFGDIVEYPIGDEGKAAPALVTGVNDDGTHELRVFSSRAGVGDVYLSSVELDDPAPAASTDQAPPTAAEATGTDQAGASYLAADQAATDQAATDQAATDQAATDQRGADAGRAHEGRTYADPFTAPQ